jgi:hypothetical protein
MSPQYNIRSQLNVDLSYFMGAISIPVSKTCTQKSHFFTESILQIQGRLRHDKWKKAIQGRGNHKEQ